MNIKSLAHVCLKSTDLDATAKFYCDALGMTKLFDFTRGGKIIGFYMKATNESFVEVFLASETEKIDKQVLSHFCLETESVKDLRAKLTEKGYESGEIKMGADHTLQFWMSDPNGMALEFQEYTKESAQLTGQSVEVDW